MIITESLRSKLLAKGFDIIGPLVKYSVPTTLKCLTTGHLTVQRLDQILYSGYGCRECFRNRTIMGRDKALEFVASKGWSSPDLTSSSWDEVATFICNKRGHTIRKKFGLFRYHHICHQCRATGNAWEDRLREFYPHFKVKSRMVNKVVVECNRCGLTDSYTLRSLSDNQHGGTTRFNPNAKGVCCPSDRNISILDLWGYTALGPTTVDNTTKKERHKFQAQCAQGHQLETSLRYLYEGHGCKVCATQKLSEGELTLGSYLTSKGFELEYRNRSLLPGGQEIDIFVPSLNLGVEYHGIIWHSWETANKSNRLGKSKRLAEFPRRAQAKKLLAHSLGINLVFIFESDLVHQPDLVWKNLDLLVSGQDVPGGDLRWVSPTGPVTAPHPHYFDQYRREVTKEQFDSLIGNKYTVWDCGHLVL